MVKYVPYETEYVTKPKELELHANTITCLIFSYMFSVLYTLTVACIASNGIHLLNWMDGWIGSGVDPDPCILTSAYSSVPLAVGHLYTWVLRSWTSSHLGVQVLDIRAPGCCASLHLASWQLGVWASGRWTSVPLAVGHPYTWLCTWPMGSWTSSRLAVGHPCVWSLDIVPLAVGRPCTWVLRIRALGLLAAGRLCGKVPLFCNIGWRWRQEMGWVCLQECGDEL